MTSNFNNNTVLLYVSKTLQNWKIHKITPQILLKAKQNKPQACQSIKMLLIKLCFLHILDYEYDLQQIGLDFDQSQEQEIENIILAHLSECQCPYLLERQQYCQSDKNHSISQQIEDQMYSQLNKRIVKVGLNFESSRSLLICCGWLMAISNYFGHIGQKKLKNILNYRDGNQNQIDKKVAISYARNCLDQVLKMPSISKNQTQKFKMITQMYRSISLHRGRIKDLGRKAFRLRNRLNQYTKRPLNQIRNGVNQSLLVDPLPKHLQEQFISVMKNQMEGMRNRQYFWEWLNISIALEIKYVKQNQLFDDHPTQIQQVQRQIVVDRGYLSNFTEKCNQFEDRVSQLNGKCDLLMNVAEQRQQLQKKQMGRNLAKTGIKAKKIGLTESQQKKIQKQVGLQIKDILFQKTIEKTINKKKITLNLPSFIGTQIAVCLGLKNRKNKKDDKIPKIKIDNQLKVQQQNLLQIRKKLKYSIQEYIKDLDALTFI